MAADSARSIEDAAGHAGGADGENMCKLFTVEGEVYCATSSSSYNIQLRQTSSTGSSSMAAEIKAGRASWKNKQLSFGRPRIMQPHQKEQLSITDRNSDFPSQLIDAIAIKSTYGQPSLQPQAGAHTACCVG
eukprot:371810-Pelagomonas_calceolata.AAC.3